MTLPDDYKVKVLKAIASKEGTPIYNGSIEHAAVLTECAFLTASKEICILTNKLEREAYERCDITSAATSFLASDNHKLRVLIESVDHDDFDLNGFYREFKDHKQVEFKIVPEHIKKSYDYNFFVMDDDSYRFEEDRARTEAVASFGGDTAAARHLKGIFEGIWGYAERVPESSISA